MLSRGIRRSLPLSRLRLPHLHTKRAAAASQHFRPVVAPTILLNGVPNSALLAAYRTARRRTANSAHEMQPLVAPAAATAAHRGLPGWRPGC